MWVYLERVNINNVNIYILYIFNISTIIYFLFKYDCYDLSNNLH